MLMLTQAMARRPTWAGNRRAWVSNSSSERSNLESLIDADEEGAGTASRVRIAPHERTAVSYHPVAEEYYYVLAGRGVAILDGSGAVPEGFSELKE